MGASDGAARTWEELAPSAHRPRRPGRGQPETGTARQGPGRPANFYLNRVGVFRFKGQVISGAPFFPERAIAGPARSSPPLDSRRLPAFPQSLPRPSRRHRRRGRCPRTPRCPAPRPPALSAWVRAAAAGPASLPTRLRPASRRAGAPGPLPASPVSLHLRPNPLPESCYF